MGPENRALPSDSKIFAIQSPKEFVEGPYRIVYKEENELWVLVAFKWDNKPSLGFRWFQFGIGSPSAYGNQTWFLLPSEFYEGILNGLNLKFQIREAVKKFLDNEMSGEELRNFKLTE